jgi:Family of unknown function (DUF5519)
MPVSDEPSNNAQASKNLGVSFMQRGKKLEDVIASWPGVSVHPHRFGAREFRFANAEVGHVHGGEIVDIPFPRSVRDALLEEGLAEEHHWVPNSGWVTFRVRNDKDFQHAIWLMRLSYFRYALKTADDPRKLFGEASQELELTARFKSLLERFLPLTKNEAPDFSSCRSNF